MCACSLFFQPQAICVANCRFVSVNATKPGSCHDSTIFKESVIGQQINAGILDTAFLLGDSGYSPRQQANLGPILGQFCHYRHR